jgi:4a-hydroxytetrahydrobiopterin dehydratase
MSPGPVDWGFFYLNGMQELPKNWSEHHNALVREFQFEAYLDGLAFVQRVGELAELVQHHPHITIDYTNVRISLQTHDEGNVVTEKDLEMARAINKL